MLMWVPGEAEPPRASQLCASDSPGMSLAETPDCAGLGGPGTLHPHPAFSKAQLPPLEPRIRGLGWGLLSLASPAGSPGLEAAAATQFLALESPAAGPRPSPI